MVSVKRHAPSGLAMQAHLSALWNVQTKVLLYFNSKNYDFRITLLSLLTLNIVLLLVNGTHVRILKVTFLHKATLCMHVGILQLLSGLETVYGT